MTPLSENLRYQRTEAFVARAIAGETVLVPIRRQIGDLESIYTLNEVATFIWERLATPSTMAEIALALEGTFAGDPAEMRTDLSTFLAEILDLGAITPADDHDPAPSL
jgi:Coenzyme PQQ synthesis protein D (PqqD)